MDKQQLHVEFIKQLNAEVKLAGYSLKSMAPLVGKSYDAFRNCMLLPGAKGYVPITWDTIIDICEVIDRTPEQIMQAARQRMSSD